MKFVKYAAIIFIIVFTILFMIAQYTFCNFPGRGHNGRHMDKAEVERFSDNHEFVSELKVDGKFDVIGGIERGYSTLVVLRVDPEGIEKFKMKVEKLKGEPEGKYLKVKSYDGAGVGDFINKELEYFLYETKCYPMRDVSSIPDWWIKPGSSKLEYYDNSTSHSYKYFLHYELSLMFIKVRNRTR